MIPHRHEQVKPEWLAAYADNELTGHQRAQVERLLAENPQAHETLEIQEALSARNAEFWESAKPPTPSLRQWREVMDRVTDKNRIGVSRAWYGWVASSALIATAAALWGLLPGGQVLVESDAQSKVVLTPAPATDVDPVVLANSDEVQIVSLPDQAGELLLVGADPLQDSSLVLAKTGEIQFFGVGSDLAGRFPELPAKDSSADETPIIWAPRGP